MSLARGYLHRDLLVIVLALALFDAPAGAQPLRHPLRWARIALVHDPCATPPYDRAQYAALLRLELAASADEDPARELDATLTDAPVRCDSSETQVSLRFALDALDVHGARTVSLDAVAPSTRARVLALAAAELVRSTTRSIDEPPRPRNAEHPVILPANLAPQRTVTREPPPARRALALDLAARVYAPLEAPGLLAFGAHVRFDDAPIASAPWLRAEASLGALYAARDDARGHFALTQLVVHGALGVVVAPALGRRLSAQAALGFELGANVLDAQARSLSVRATSGAAAGASVFAQTRLGLALGPHVQLSLALALGATLAGVEATSDTRVALRTAGPFGALSLGLTYAW